MKKYIPIGVIFAAALALGACSEKISNTILKIQAATTTACNFLPTAASLTTLVNANAGATVADLSGKICAAIAALPGAAPMRALHGSGAVVVIVDGVAIVGEMVEGEREMPPQEPGQ